LISKDLEHLHANIRSLFTTNKTELKEICDYYFDGSGKSMRPLIVCTLARALNKTDPSLSAAELDTVFARQRQIALIAEMIHVASLIHDDIIDASSLRRGKTSVHTRYGCHKAVLAGDYVMGSASKRLADLANVHVVEAMSMVLEDLVRGELMQLGTKESESERFQHYSLKTYRKTASLVANSCKSVAHLLLEEKQGSEGELVSTAFEFGKNLGMAFQLIDDVLDFTSHSDKMGKPGTGADLRLGLATAPVLFAANKHPQLHAMIMRRFGNEGDAMRAFEFVMNSDGIKETRFLASKYCENAEGILDKLVPSAEVDYLRHLIKTVINREK
jgi:decaprenyl-diphosphate synthase subunit 1